MPCILITYVKYSTTNNLDFFSRFTSGSCSLSKYTKLCMVWQISVICCELSGGEKPHFTFFNKQTKYVLSFYRQQICQRQQRCVVHCCQRWHPLAPPGFLTGGVRYGSIGGLEYEVPQSRLYCLCINLSLIHI